MTSCQLVHHVMPRRRATVRMYPMSEPEVREEARQREEKQGEAVAERMERGERRERARAGEIEEADRLEQKERNRVGVGETQKWVEGI
eukprot:2667330-Rhodomonas_salina.1